MKEASLFRGSCRLSGRQFSLWLTALAASVLFPSGPAQAQWTTTTVNPNGSTTVQSTVGGPNGISFTFGGPGKLPIPSVPHGGQPHTGQPWSPSNPHGTWIPISQIPPAPPMTFRPAVPPLVVHWPPSGVLRVSQIPPAPPLSQAIPSTWPPHGVLPVSQIPPAPPMNFAPALPPIGR